MVKPLPSAFDSLVGGLSRSRATIDEAASAIAADPFDVEAIVSLNVSTAAMSGMARALRVSAETQEALFDALA